MHGWFWTWCGGYLTYMIKPLDFQINLTSHTQNGKYWSIYQWKEEQEKNKEIKVPFIEIYQST